MSKKLYERTAAVLLAETAVTTRDLAARRTVENITYSLADIFAQDNPRFDREKFYEAAGMPGGVRYHG